jgi:uncharacterized protein (TIGR03067 family)
MLRLSFAAGWTRCVFVATCFATAASLAAPPDGTAKQELSKHQGTWAVKSSIFDGQPASAELVKSIEMIVTDDHVVWKRDGKSFAGTKIVLDPSARPSAIDVIPDGGRYMGEHVLGIYRFERETLSICMAAPGKPRPTAFTADKGSGWTLRVFCHKGTPLAR